MTVLRRIGLDRNAGVPGRYFAAVFREDTMTRSEARAVRIPAPADGAAGAPRTPGTTRARLLFVRLELARLEEVGAGPFRPGPGGFPPYLAGREREQGLFRGLLARLDRGEAPPSEVILYGPRGNGKTVLLEWIGEFASGSTGVDVEELTPSEFKSPTRLAELLLPAGWWKTLKPDEIGVRGITWRPGKRSAAPDPVEVLALRAARKPLVVLLDEAHTLDPESVARS